MNCRDFGNIIHELVSGRVADKTKQLEALDHAGQCLWCARRLDDESKLTGRLQDFARRVEGQRAPLRVEAELLQAFRERKLREGTPLFAGIWSRIWRGAAWGLAFAAMAGTTWVMVNEWPRLHRGRHDGASQVAAGRPKVGSDASHATGTQGSGVTHASLNGSAAARRAHVRGVQHSVPKESAGETATDFISLGTCDDSQCMEEATLVRVALPAEALLAFGLGTDKEYAPDATVQADVALGSDGVPFAIRFVN